jgi:NAD(P)-dependent dehydrogenase (short-subunit alcohol dehydrogenase family)
MSTTIITGGAGGIGQQVGRRILTDWPGSKCALIDLHAENVGAMVDQFGAQRVLPLPCDVSDPVAVEAAVTTVATWASPITSLVNAAGIQCNEASFDLAFSDWQRVLGTHLDGTFLFCQQVGKHMAVHDGGAIVNLASVAMFVGYPRRLAYATAKAGIGALTRTLAVEWAAYGIRVNAVAPGYIETPLLSEAIERGHVEAQAMRSLHALNRFGTTDEVANAIMFLLSDAASFITGEVLRVDGGFTVQKLPRSPN